MASRSLRYPKTVAPSSTPITRVQVLLLGGLSVGALLWGWSLISGQELGNAVSYLALLGIYGVASAVFVFGRTKENHLSFFDIPVFLTVLVFVEFGLAPLECFIDPSQLAYEFAGHDHFLLEALLYVMAGMVAFWVGCIIADRKTRQRRAPGVEAEEKRAGRSRIRVLAAVGGVYAVAFSTKVYLLTHHLYSYLASGKAYWSNLPSMQVLNVVTGLGTYALVIACIEMCFRPDSQKWKLIFWTIFFSECFWGLISGMKGALIQNFLIVGLVSSLIQRKFRKGWVLAAVLALIALYPVAGAYRAVVRGGGEEVTSFSSARKAGAEALSRVKSNDPEAGAELESGWRSTVSRLDLLQSVGLVMVYGPSAKAILGRERWWMLPFYPFIPRFIWRSKPVLLEGGRFSVLLGYGGPDSKAETVGTSTAVTYPGDLYIRGGMTGILFGMFVLGVVGQWLTSRVSGTLDRRRLFIYAAIFLTVVDMELDAFSFWATLIKTFVILSIVARIAYGARPVLARKRATARALFART